MIRHSIIKSFRVIGQENSFNSVSLVPALAYVAYQTSPFLFLSSSDFQPLTWTSTMPSRLLWTHSAPRLR